MKVFLLLAFLAVAQAGVLKPDPGCDGVVIDGVFYEEEVLKTDIDRPLLLAIDRKTNTVFFSYNDVTSTVFVSARVDINTKDFKDIEGITDGYAQAVDQNTNEVYIGGSKGIYKYDYKTNKAEFFAEKDVDIWDMSFKDVLYYTTTNLYKFVDGKPSKLGDFIVGHFTVDKDNDIFFTNSKGLYSLKAGTTDPVFYKELGPVRTLTTDINGNPYICLYDGVYAINKATSSVEKLVNTNDVYGLAFDKDNNMVLSNSNGVILLKPNKEKNCQSS